MNGGRVRHHHIAEGERDVPIDGFGGETYRFRSKPLRIFAIDDGKSPVDFFTKQGNAVLQLEGTVKRAGELHVGPGKACAEGNGTGTSDKSEVPDCGTKKVRTEVQFAYLSRPKELLVLSDGEGKDPFRNCPRGVAEQAPQLLTYDDKDRHIGVELGVDDLFKYGKHIAIARGTSTTRVPETNAKSSIKWTLTFTRVPKRKKH